jgi:streptogramin lyase
MAIHRYRWPALVATDVYSIPSNAGPQVLGDCAVLGGTLYYADVGKDTVGSIDLTTGAVDGLRLGAPASRPRSVAADAGTLWISCDDAPLLFQLSPGGALLAAIPNTATVNGCEGLEAAGGRLFCSDTASGAVRVFSKIDGAVLEGPTPIPSWEGMVVIANTLWVGTNSFIRDGSVLTRPAGPYLVGLVPLPIRTSTSAP